MEALTGKYQSLELHLVVPTSGKYKVLVLKGISSFSYNPLSNKTQEEEHQILKLHN